MKQVGTKVTMPQQEQVKLVGSKSSADGTSIVQKTDRKLLKCIAWYVIVQCILVFIGAETVIHCLWNPEYGLFEIDTLSRIMYLYDTNVCGKTRSLQQFRDLQLSNETFGLNIIPIRHAPVSLTVLSKLSGKTRKYLKVSIGLHIVWFLSAVVLRIIVNIKNMKVFKIVLMIFRYVTIAMVVFDISMAVVYIADIQQSLTKAMIIRYSGWGMTPRQVDNPEQFGGWIPILASVAWLRGGIFFGINLYLGRFVKRVMKKITGREVKSRLSTLCNVPFPDADYRETHQDSLYYRAGAGGYYKF